MSLGYPWDNGEPLSAIGEDSSGTVTERSAHVLLRPVYINAVEVGYAFSQMDKDRRLHVRGITIAIWHFLSKGHQVVALLPHCFKTYSDKCSNWQELMNLFRMNLVEFTPGFGSDKYVEVNRILASRARDTGGCIVARSQMHNIIEESPQLDKTVEKRLLMPAFNGDDLIFPMDGPLGRIGPTLNKTLQCQPSDQEWGACSHHQMTLSDQRIWTGRMAALVPEKTSWMTLANKIDSFTPITLLTTTNTPLRPQTSVVHRVLPPESNPPDGRGFSHERRALRRNGYDVYHFPRVEQSPMQLPTAVRNVDDLFLPGYMVDGNNNSSSNNNLCQENEQNEIESSSPPSRGAYGMPGVPSRYNGFSNGGNSYNNNDNCRGFQNNRNDFGFPRGNVGGHRDQGDYDGFSGRSPPVRGQFRRRGDAQPGSFGRSDSFSPRSYSDTLGGRSSPQFRAQPKFERVYDRRSDSYFERVADGEFLHAPILNVLFPERGNAPNVPRFDSVDSSRPQKRSKEEDLKETFSQVAAILGWEKAKEVTEIYPGVRSVALLIEYALDGPPQTRRREEGQGDSAENAIIEEDEDEQEEEEQETLATAIERDSTSNRETADFIDSFSPDTREIEQRSSNCSSIAPFRRSEPSAFGASWNKVQKKKVVVEAKRPRRLRVISTRPNVSIRMFDLTPIAYERNFSTFHTDSMTSLHTAISADGETPIYEESTVGVIAQEVNLIDFEVEDEAPSEEVQIELHIDNVVDEMMTSLESQHLVDLLD